MKAPSSLAPLLQSMLRSGRFNRWLVALVVVLGLVALYRAPDESAVSTTVPTSGSQVVAPAADRPAELASPRERSASSDVELVEGRGRSRETAAWQLHEERPGVFRSPAGLVYTRGSQHGHRVQHVLAHAHDAPDRPGQHGVFGDGRKEVILALVDEAYLRAQNGSADRRRDQQRTILTVDMDRPIGFVGGQVGNRRGVRQPGTCDWSWKTTV